MKRNHLLTLFVILAFLGHSQISIWVDNKYGFKMPGSYDQYGGYGDNTASSSSSTYKSKKFCFGNGYQVGVGLRYAFKNNFGIDLGYAYLLGQKSTTEMSNSSTGYYYSGTNEIKARFSRIMLGVAFQGDKKISPAFKAGMLASFGKLISSGNSTSTQTTYTYDPLPPYNSYTVTTTTQNESATEYYGGISLGFYASLGVNYKVSEKINLSLFIDAVFNDYSPNKGRLTVSKKNGVDQLGQMTTHDKEVVYKKEYTTLYSSTPNNNEPDVAAKFSVPLSSFGPTFSINFILGKKSTTETTPKTTN